MKAEMTRKLAITGVDDSITSPCIFRVFESVVGDGVECVQLYSTTEGRCYFIVGFKSLSLAKRAYDLCDGVEIEQTGNVLNLSFVPEDMELDSLVEECESSRDFVHFRNAGRKMVLDESMIQLSDDNVLDIEIPEEHKTRACEEDVQTFQRQNVSNAEIKVSNDGESDELEGFQLDLKDERLVDLFDDDDFTLDASNKGFRLQRASRDIFNQKLRHIEKE